MEKNRGFKHRVKSPAEMSNTILKLGKYRVRVERNITSMLPVKMKYEYMGMECIALFVNYFFEKLSFSN
jgi:hypothetical protein